MRTTVTLDDDVVAGLKGVIREQDVSFKQALNDAVRAGLNAVPATGEPFVVRSRPMGQRAGVDLDKALRLAADLEDDEIVRKMALGK